MKTHGLVTASTSDAFLPGLAHELMAAGFWSAPIIIGVSGGADSVALLLGICDIASTQTKKPSLIVVHAQHDLRTQAGADRAFVESLAQRLGLTFLWRDLPLGNHHDRHSNGVESRARELRYAFFADVAHETGARHVVVAHTADDQAETILHRALRGTGLAGLGGMATARELCAGVALMRPLLQMRRETVRHYLAEIAQPWCEDHSNTDIRYARNFLRHEILAPLAAGFYPAAAESLTRLGRQASLVAAALASAADQLLDIYSQRHAGGNVLLQTAALSSLDRHLVAEIFVSLWRRENWPRRDMTARHYAALADMACAAADMADMASLRHSAMPRRAAIDLPGGMRSRIISAGVVEVTREN